VETELVALEMVEAVRVSRRIQTMVTTAVQVDKLGLHVALEAAAVEVQPRS
jgi:hypothetical protein